MTNERRESSKVSGILNRALPGSTGEIRISVQDRETLKLEFAKLQRWRGLAEVQGALIESLRKKDHPTGGPIVSLSRDGATEEDLRDLRKRIGEGALNALDAWMMENYGTYADWDNEKALSLGEVILDILEEIERYKGGSQ